jgi:hypothetical protein
MKETLFYGHLWTFFLLKLHKHMQGQDEAVDIDSLAPGDINGVQDLPFVAKKAMRHIALTGTLKGPAVHFYSHCFHIFLILVVLSYMADSSKIMVSPSMVHISLWTSLMKALEHLVMLRGERF